MTRSDPKIHYRPSPCACGRYHSPARLTTDIDEVTCSSCADRIVKYQLQPRSDFPDVPTFNVVAGEPYHNGCGCHVWFRCPVCGKRNTHGRPGDKIGGGDGHRVSHCRCWDGGYVIREIARADDQ